MTVKWNKKVIEAVKTELKKEVVTQVALLEKEAKRLILETPKTGRMYRRGGVLHQASAEGEPYASDSGQTMSKVIGRGLE